MEKNIDITVRADRKLAWYRGDSVRYLVLDIVGRETEESGSEKREPLNLALVIDRSGSMHGAPVQAAKKAAAGVVEMLGKEDLLTVVCFDNEVDTIIKSLAMDDAGKAEAQKAIRRIRSKGMTDLEAGWLRGAEYLAENMELSESFRNNIVLLSDGMANRGETDPEVLGEYANGLQARGILSTTVGIGDNYSPEILQAIAENGGGRMHDAEHPAEIVEVVTAELGELSQVIADNLRVDVQVPPDTGCKLLSSRQLNRESENGYSCLLGTLASRGSRQIVFQVTLPAGHDGDEQAFHCTASWSRESGTDSCKASASIKLVRGRKNNGQQRDVDCSLIVAAVWQSQLIRKITRINFNRNYERLRDIQAGEFRYFEKYCHGLPGAETMIEGVERLLRRAHRPMRERSRKEMTLAAYKAQSCERDYRTNERGSWDSFIDD